MTYMERARDIVGDAEQKLRSLIENAAREGRYADVSVLAGMAEKVASLSASGEALSEGAIHELAPLDTTPHMESPPPGAEVPLTPARIRTVPPRLQKSARHPARTDFPRFERERDKLIKVGWSERDKRVYEHRAPKQVVARVAQELVSRYSSGVAFKMEELLPELTIDDGVVPSYQAYLTLAWLRSLDAVERQGKEGYVLKNGKLTSESLKELWQATAVRR